MRKEYNDRWNTPLVNPPVTLGEHDKSKSLAKEKFYLNYYKQELSDILEFHGIDKAIEFMKTLK